jgi:UDP-N-acetylmuramyl pentapeptide synthase
MNYSISEIADILGLKNINLHDSTVSVLLTDSRSLTFPEESMFFAIKSNKNNGHKYIYPLYKKGVRNFIVTEDPSQKELMEDANFLYVKDSLKALQQIAKHHRSIFDIPVIGITGSNGKTIVKEWLYQLLQEDKNIVRSPRSYNSQIGVPLSIWQLNKTPIWAFLRRAYQSLLRWTRLPTSSNQQLASSPILETPIRKTSTTSDKKLTKRYSSSKVAT